MYREGFSELLARIKQRPIMQEWRTDVRGLHTSDEVLLAAALEHLAKGSDLKALKRIYGISPTRLH
jgi:hypothetical protein